MVSSLISEKFAEDLTDEKRRSHSHHLNVGFGIRLLTFRNMVILSNFSDILDSKLLLLYYTRSQNASSKLRAAVVVVGGVPPSSSQTKNVKYIEWCIKQKRFIIVI